MKTFVMRSQQHDRSGVLLVSHIFETQGLVTFPAGIETADQPLWDALIQQHDSLSLMLRFRPDLIVVKPGVRTFLCEVKTEGNHSQNFAVEWDSYEAAKQWNQWGKYCIYAFVDVQTQHVYGAYAKDIPVPKVLYVPTRPGYRETIARIRLRSPWTRVRETAWHRGSGTAYFLLPKHAGYLQPIQQVLTDMFESVPHPTE